MILHHCSCFFVRLYFVLSSLIFQDFLLSKFWSLKSSSVTKMARRLNVDELNRIAAENGFVAGAHFTEDEIRQRKDPFTPRYLKNQEESLELWAALVAIDVGSVQHDDSLMVFS